ncbi:MAG: T9SS type A sorting domain-containing protein [Bacteroidota bacterium]
MKKLFLLLLILLEVNCANASHMMGGEITWQCSGSNYIFTLKVYRDCRGSGFTTATQQLTVIGHPSISSISCAFVSSTDLSAPGCGYSCADPVPPQGATEEFIFKSAPVNLGTGTPPATGWTFSWNLCCRNGNILNLNSPGSLGMTLRSKMFSYNGQPVTPCFDNSPAFAERPHSFVCTGSAFRFSNTAFDVELDSLIYIWDKPADNIPPMLLNYRAPYTVTNQLPGSPVMEQHTGQVSLTPDTSIMQQGDFVTCIRLDAFKCNVKVAEIYREMQVGLSYGCPFVFGGGLNHPPLIEDNTTFLSMPFYNDTVYAGDTVSLSFRVSDSDINTSPVAIQTVTFNAEGLQFGTNDTGGTGCLYPPCAMLDHATPIIFSGSNILQFNWVTDCHHVGSYNGCYHNQTVHQFVLKADDNYCPAIGTNVSTITIVVQGPVITSVGSTLTCNFPNGTLQWYVDNVLIPGATGSSIQATSPGFYSVISTLASGCSISSPPFPFGVSGIDAANTIINTQILPNPSHGTFDLLFSAAEKGNGIIRIVDLSGKIIDEFAVSFQKGENKFPVDLTSFSSGIYELQLNGENFLTHHKIIID